MKNWKTFLSGIVVVAGVLSGPIKEKRLPNLQEATVITGVLGLGTAAKDKDVTGAGMYASRVSSGPDK